MIIRIMTIIMIRRRTTTHATRESVQATSIVATDMSVLTHKTLVIILSFVIYDVGVNDDYEDMTMLCDGYGNGINDSIMAIMSTAVTDMFVLTCKTLLII